MGKSDHNVMPRTMPYRPGSDAIARIQVGTCAQGPEAAAAAKQVRSADTRQTTAMRLGALAARAAVYRPITWSVGLCRGLCVH